MCLRTTIRFASLLIGASVALCFGQELKLDWRQVGNLSIRHLTGDAASGPVLRVWFTGNSLAVSTKSGEVWERTETEQWKESSLEAPLKKPHEAGGRLYRVNGDAYRSDDDGVTWENLTQIDGSSILGGPLSDIAVSPSNPDDVVAVGSSGVWRSLDGGLTWSGLNQGLPNLQIKKILALPSGMQGMRVATEDSLLEWHPGQKLGWFPSGNAPANSEIIIEAQGKFLYLGFKDGRIFVSRDGIPRLINRPSEDPVRRFWVHPQDPSVALAILGTRVFRTFNGGTFWDDITGPLQAGQLYGVAADVASGSIYVASDNGVFYGSFDFQPIGAVTAWQRLATPIRNRRAHDVRLDAAGNQIYAALDGYGVFAARAPHRRKQPVLVNAADSAGRSASPGSLMSIVGQAITSVKSGDHSVPVLASTEDESQVQIPFEVQGRNLPLQLENGSSQWNVSVPIDQTSPAIFIDTDSSPMLLDGDSGVMLDAMNPARSGTRLQILTTGLGRVTPDWPTGLSAPLENPPAVNAPIRVLLDGQPLEVTRATLAPGYVGFYLIEAQIPLLVNSGTAELYIEANGLPSNRVRVYIEP